MKILNYTLRKLKAIQRELHNNNYVVSDVEQAWTDLINFAIDIDNELGRDEKYFYLYDVLRQFELDEKTLDSDTNPTDITEDDYIHWLGWLIEAIEAKIKGQNMGRGKKENKDMKSLNKKLNEGHQHFNNNVTTKQYELIKETANDCGWDTVIMDDGIEFETWSPMGENLIEFLDTRDGLEFGMKNFISMLYDFDADYHVEMLLQAKRDGLQGVPTARELVHDADEITEIYRELAGNIERAFDKVLNESKALKENTLEGLDENYVLVVEEDLDQQWEFDLLFNNNEGNSPILTWGGYDRHSIKKWYEEILKFARNNIEFPNSLLVGFKDLVTEELDELSDTDLEDLIEAAGYHIYNLVGYSQGDEIGIITKEELTKESIAHFTAVAFGGDFYTFKIMKIGRGRLIREDSIYGNYMPEVDKGQIASIIEGYFEVTPAYYSVDGGIYYADDFKEALKELGLKDFDTLEESTKSKKRIKKEARNPKHIWDLSKKQVEQLLEDIVINSLYEIDYENRFGIDPQEVYTYVEGWLESMTTDDYGKYKGDEFWEEWIDDYSPKTQAEELYNYIQSVEPDLEESKKLNERIQIGTEIYDGSSLQDWAYNNAWSGAKDRLEDIDNYSDGWDYLFEILDDEGDQTETYINDFLLFDALDILEAHFGSDEDRLYTYLFPALTEEDHEELDNYDLEVFATHENGAVEVLGTKRDLKHYASEYLDYVLVEGYLEEY